MTWYPLSDGALPAASAYPNIRTSVSVIVRAEMGR